MKQGSDREIVTELVNEADAVGVIYERCGLGTDDYRKAVKRRSHIENAVIERLIKRQEKIQQLQDKIANLRHELNGYR